MKHKIAILGAAGAVGKELLRLLLSHPSFEIFWLSSDLHANKRLDAFEEYHAYPELAHLEFVPHQSEVPKDCSVFLATPDAVSMLRAPILLEKGHRCVDLSGAFRLRSQSRWESAYLQAHSEFKHVPKFAYGLPELFRKSLRSYQAIANPGCYPSSVIFPLAALAQYIKTVDLAIGIDSRQLGLWVLLEKRLASITINSSSGYSGAGARLERPEAMQKDSTRAASVSLHEADYYAYKVMAHQHEAEIQDYVYSAFSTNPSLVLEEATQQHLYFADAERICPVHFTTHLLPIERGILSTITLHWKDHAPSEEDLAGFFKGLAQRETFLRYHERPEDVRLNCVRRTNYIDMSLRSRSRTTIIITAIDNLVKGAAGQAIQNMNILHGLAEDSGLLEIAKDRTL